LIQVLVEPTCAASAIFAPQPISDHLTGLQFFVQVNANLSLLGRDTLDAPHHLPLSLAFIH
jgi:hypothetical protein